jgi:hypothetical protein
MKRLKLTIDLFFALWQLCPVWLKTILIIALLILMGQHGIFDKPY